MYKYLIISICIYIISVILIFFLQIKQDDSYIHKLKSNNNKSTYKLKSNNNKSTYKLKSNNNEKKKNDFMYITLIELEDSILFVSRLIINDNLKTETIKFYKLNKKNYDFREIDCYINGKNFKEIHTSINHNFTLSKVGKNKYIANAGRDKWSDTKHYDKGHDKGMYFFQGYQYNDNFYFKELGLGINKNTGLLQYHPASNECYTPIIKDNDRYLIYCRYNIDNDKRLVQIFESKDGMKDWKLFSIFNLRDFNNILIPYNYYSIYCISVCIYNEKFIALIKFSGKKKAAVTNDDSYILYLCLSDDG